MEVKFFLSVFSIFCICGYLPSFESAISTGGKLVDLTHDFDETTIYLTLERHLQVNIIENFTVPGSNRSYYTEEIIAPVHFGTHIDAPCFYFDGQWCVSDIPLDRLVLPAIVVDISDQVKDNPKRHLTVADLQEWESNNGRIPDGSLLLLRTGWSQFWSNPLKYVGRPPYSENTTFPTVTVEAAQWLTSERGIYGIGVDSPSIDVLHGTNTHNFLLRDDVYALENLKNLHLVPTTGTTAIVMPMKLKNMTGAATRVVAHIP